jgi:sugar phosphate isomerase/epimerase
MHQRLSINSVCFGGSSFRDLAGLWSAIGVQRVSLVSDLILTEGRAAAQVALQSGPYALETITHVFMPGRHLEPNAAVWQQARTRLNDLIESAAALGGRSIYLITGGHGTLTWEQAAAAFCDAVAPCVARAQATGILLMVENAPAVYAHSHIAHTLRDAVTLAEMAGVGVCMDVFACWTEAGLQETIARVMPRLHVVQLCDYVYGDRALPARAVPGDGAIPIKRIVEWLLRAGYTGAFDLELIGPRIDHEGHLAATRRAAQNVTEILNSLAA